jgi:lipopolysaccharide transport system ATP-binding protein
MGMITSLCQRAILLEGGQIVFDGGAAEAVAKYFTRDGGAPFAVDYTKRPKKIGDQFATLRQAWIEDMDGRRTGEIDIRSGFKIKMRYTLDRASSESPVPGFHFYNSQGQCAFLSGGRHSSEAKVGSYEVTCFVPSNLLNNDTYFIDLSLAFMDAGPRVSFHERGALSVVIVDPIDETLHSNSRNGYSGVLPGVVRPQIDCKVRQIS